MGTMAREAETPPRNQRSPWLPAFVVAIGVFAGSLVALAWVLFDVISDGETQAAPETPGLETPTGEPRETPTIDGRVTYAGELPAAAAELGLVPSEPGATAD